MMTSEAPLQRTAAEDALVATYAKARDQLPGVPSVRERRDAAYSIFERFGLPHRRVEAWKYTDLRALMKDAAPLAQQLDAAAMGAVREADPLEGLDRARLVVANGHFRPDLSDLQGIDGVVVEPLADVLEQAPERVGALFDDGNDVVMALNTALMQGGVAVMVPANAHIDRPIEIAHLTASDEPVAVVSRVVVSVGENAEVKFLESHHGNSGVAYQVNTLTELDMAKAARVSWSRVQAESAKAQHLSSLVVRVDADASLKHVSVNRGAALARWQCFARIIGPGASVAFNGATMLGDQQRSDSTLVLRHDAPHTSSHELFKSVVEDRGQGAFQGMISVEAEAQKTDASMMSQAMLLSDEAQFSAKPELEIFADDVRCGHGATSSNIDPGQLFYLRARGLPREEAEKLLIEAFLDDAIDIVDDGAIASALRGVVSAWLTERSAG